MGQFEQVAKEIISNTINAAYCIDDEFVEPYETPSENSDLRTSQTLYRAFKSEGCSLDVGRFQSLEVWEDTQKDNLKTKDLLILDWELARETPKYAPALNILHDAIKTPTLPFVCIYTNAGNLDSVEDSIISYFCNPSNHSHDNFEELLEVFCEKVAEELGNDDYFGSEELEWLAELSVYAFDGVKYPERFKASAKETSKKIIEKQKSDFSGNLFKALNASSKSVFGLEFKEFMVALHVHSHAQLSLTDNTNYALERFSFDGDIHCLLVGSTVVIVCHKEGNQNAVAAETLFTKLAEVIHNRPNNFMSLLSLECRNFFRDEAKSIGKDLSQIDDEAFFWHQESVVKGSGGNYEFEAFLKELWNSSLAGDWSSFSPKMIGVLDDYKNEKDISEKLAVHKANKAKGLISDLAFLNKKYSILRMEPVNSERLHFGDIFEGAGKYYICITAHCDCLRPDNINHNYMFIESDNTLSLEKGLEIGDTGFHSFFDNASGQLINVGWKQKPFTIHIPLEEVDTHSAISVTISGRSVELNYVCTQKENYTQRIANNSLSFANRVGINFADIKGLEEE